MAQPTVINLNDALPPPPSGGVNVKWQADASVPIRNVSAYVVPSTSGGGGGGTSSTSVVPTSGPYTVVCFIPSQPGDQQLILAFRVERQVTFPANFNGSQGRLTSTPSGTVSYIIKKNGVQCGTVTITTAGAFTFATTGSAAVVFNPGPTPISGDEFSVTAPHPQDGSLTDVGLTFAGTWSGNLPLAITVEGLAVIPWKSLPRRFMPALVYNAPIRTLPSLPASTSVGFSAVPWQTKAKFFKPEANAIPVRSLPTVVAPQNQAQWMANVGQKAVVLPKASTSVVPSLYKPPLIVPWLPLVAPHSVVMPHGRSTEVGLVKGEAIG